MSDIVWIFWENSRVKYGLYFSNSFLYISKNLIYCFWKFFHGCVFGNLNFFVADWKWVLLFYFLKYYSMNIFTQTLISSWLVLSLIFWYSFTFWEAKDIPQERNAQEWVNYEEAEKIALRYLENNKEDIVWYGYRTLPYINPVRMNAAWGNGYHSNSNMSLFHITNIDLSDPVYASEVETTIAVSAVWYKIQQ